MRRQLQAVLDAVARVPLWVLTVLGVLVRVLADVVVPASGVPLYEFGVIAGNATTGRGFSYFASAPPRILIDEARSGTPLPSAFMPPLHTFVVIAAHAVADRLGTGPLGVVWGIRAANLVLAVLLLWAVARLVAVAASPRAARFAVLGCALYPSLVYQATQVSASNTYLPVEVGLLATALGLRREVRAGRLAVAGLLGAALGLLRAEAVLLLMGVAVWLVVFAGRGHLDRRHRLRVATVLLVLALAPAAGWAVRSSVVFDRPTATLTSTAGFNLWVGNRDEASGSHKGYTVPAPLAARLAALPPTPDYELRRDAVFADAAREDVAADPGRAAVRTAKKFGMVLGTDPYDERSRSPAYLACYGLLVLLGVPGAVRWWRERRRDDPGDRSADAVLLGGWLVLSLVVPTVFFVLARYRLPLELGLLMGTAVLLAHGSRLSDRPPPCGRPEGPRATPAGGPVRSR